MARQEAEPGMELDVFNTPEAAISALRGETVPEIQDPEAVSRAIMERILSATSVDEVLGGQTVLHMQDVLARPFTLHGVRYMKSKFDDGMGVFAVLDCEFLDDGARENVTSSARNVMTQAAMLWKLDALPQTVMFQQSDKPAASGNYVYWLAPVKGADTDVPY